MLMTGIPDIARSQQGVFTAQQAREAGFTARQVRRRQANGEWIRVAGRGLTEREPGPPRPAPPAPRLPRPQPSDPSLPGPRSPVPHSPGTPSHPAHPADPADPADPGKGRAGAFSPRVLLWAAQLTWPEAVACRRSAAVVHGFPVRPGPEAEVLSERPRRSTAGIRPVNDGVPPGQVCVVGGLRVTDRERTALDCLAFLPFDEALDLYVWLWARREIPRERVVAAVQGRIGRPGAVQLRRLLTATRGGPVSGAGYRLQRLLKASGVEGWSPGGPATGLADPAAASEVTFPRARLVVAVRSVPVQGLRVRYRTLAELGFLVLSSTSREVTDCPAAVVGRVRHALSVRRRVPPAPVRPVRDTAVGVSLGAGRPQSPQNR